MAAGKGRPGAGVEVKGAGCERRGRDSDGGAGEAPGKGRPREASGSDAAAPWAGEGRARGSRESGAAASLGAVERGSQRAGTWWAPCPAAPSSWGYGAAIPPHTGAGTGMSRSEPRVARGVLFLSLKWGCGVSPVHRQCLAFSAGWGCCRYRSMEQPAA